MCSTSAAKQAAIAIRGGERPARRKSTQKALDEQQRRRAPSPRIPCSAATVTGIVCDAEVAFWVFALRVVQLVLRFEGARAVALRAAVARTVRGRPRSASCARWSRCWSTLPSPSGRSAGSPGASSSSATPSASTAARRRTACRAASQRQAASTARPSSSAAMLDCEKLVTSPREQPREHGRAAISTSRRRPLHSTTVVERDHHEREEAPVDVRVEEDRVDAEVVVELVRRDHLGVQEQRLARVLDEADPREQRPPARPRSPRHRSSSSRVQRDLPQEQEQQAEGNVEEGEVRRRLRGIARVDRLQARRARPPRTAAS